MEMVYDMTNEKFINEKFLKAFCFDVNLGKTKL